MATAFETALDTAADQVVGYAEDALPYVAVVATIWLGVKYVRRLVKSF